LIALRGTEFSAVADFLLRAAARLLPSRFDVSAPEDPNRTMRGVQYAEHGAANVLRYADALPRPLRRPGQTLVRVHATAVNPVDLKMRFHRIASSVFPLPKIPGTDFAGVVAETDEDSDFQEGQSVFGMMPLLGTRWGTCATYLAVSDHFLAAAPQNVSHVQAAALPLVGLTVLEGLEKANADAVAARGNSSILIQGGSGGLGTFAIQYCTNALGLRVVTTCRASQREYCRSLGAQQTIDYAAEAFEEVVRDMDLILDPFGHRYAKRTFESNALSATGHYIHVAGSDQTEHASWGTIPEAAPWNLLKLYGPQWLRTIAAAFGIPCRRYHVVFVHPSKRHLQTIRQQVETGNVIPQIDRTFPLHDTAEAHRYLERSGRRGKVVIEID
jgi:alcohol dehydrogenase